MDTNALQGRTRAAQGAKTKAGRSPGESLQRSDARVRQRAGRGEEVERDTRERAEVRFVGEQPPLARQSIQLPECDIR